MEENTHLDNMTDNYESSLFNQKQAEYFDFENPPVPVDEIVELLTRKVDELKVVGMSLNQVRPDLNYRVFCINSEDKGTVMFFNPELKSVSQETCMMREGDALIPEIFVNLKRPRIINIEYQDDTGELRDLTLDEVAARCALHEMDNLNGVLFFARASRLKLQRALKARDKKFKKRSMVRV